MHSYSWFLQWNFMNLASHSHNTRIMLWVLICFKDKQIKHFIALRLQWIQDQKFPQFQKPFLLCHAAVYRHIQRSLKARNWILGLVREEFFCTPSLFFLFSRQSYCFDSEVFGWGDEREVLEALLILTARLSFLCVAWKNLLLWEWLKCPEDRKRNSFILRG